MRTSFSKQNGHYQVWIFDGVGLPVAKEINEWLNIYGRDTCLGICGASSKNVKGIFYNFADVRVARHFALVWGNE